MTVPLGENFMLYLYPPRPSGRMPPGNLARYEKLGAWVVQLKFNGTRTVIQITPNGKVNFFNRHDEKHKQFTPSKEIIAEVLSLDLARGKEHWLDGELLKNKTTDSRYKERVVLFDVLMLDGKYLFGSPTQMVRLEVLKKICRFPTKLEPANGVALVATEHLWMAETWDTHFAVHFNQFLDTDEIEGVVLRKKNSVIDNVGTKEYEVDWLIRCRKPHKNYNY